ncbi:2-oxoglutarate (2OG) and Fe(II)-dependent oxygenase superfamily protein [Euphorbia peplus]|nr:2-oxoglutarate (2OG) and Fe(II)-dependent oxygenase superfamily protein [Euphorbia peplus]
MGEIVDPAFIQAEEHRPKLQVNGVQGIPLIDLSEFDIVNKVGDACREWGFFQVINHGVPIEKRDSFFNASSAFFGQTLEEKNKVRRDEKRGVGYYDTEHTKNVRDWKEVFDVYVENPMLAPSSHVPNDIEVTQYYNQWPPYPPQLREVCEEYGKEMERLGYTLLELVAKSLGLKADKFHGFFKDQTSRIRLNHYPPCPVPELALGVGRHKDGGALTILAQDDVGGLQVKRKSDGDWIFVNPIPNSYIINVGDALQVWSNDKYESVEHRVMLNGAKERFSIPFFFDPSHYTVVQPLDELIDDKNRPKYRPYSWGKFMMNRRYSNFKKLDVENLQTYHFKINN